MNDKERILMEIIAGLQRTGLTQRSAVYKSDEKPDGVYFDMSADAKPGDIVLCQTSAMSNPNDFVVAIVDQVLGYGHCLLREIGSDNTCDYSNERFIPIRGLRDWQRYEGEQWRFYVNSRAAFALGDEYSYRFGGVDFDGKKAHVWVREVFGGMLDKGMVSEPFSVTIDNWKRRNSPRKILNDLRHGGYGTFEFLHRVDATNNDAA